MPGPRNLEAAPYLSGEGVLVQPLRIPKDLLLKGDDWSDGLSPFDRVHYHQTLSSVRRYTHFKPLPGLLPVDALDVTLGAEYDHGVDQFGEKVDVVLQGSTIGTDTRRKTRNVKDISMARDAVSAAVHEALNQDEAKKINFEGSCFGNGTDIKEFTTKEVKKKKHVKYNEYHLVHLGGIIERKHPSNVKLMNSSHHSPQTNAGYSRQDRDGNAYQY